jgi:tRNA dimethylallyltransferase
MKAIGVRELRAVLDHELSIDEALERICTQTRRYAKRQITWSRGRMTDWHWVASPEEGLEHARRHLSSC